MLITEGKAKIEVGKVFYNPMMKFNRDLTILLLNSIDKMGMRIALPLAATGVRGIRLLLELEEGKVKELHMNDYSSESVKLIKRNLNLNNITTKVYLHNMDANIFLLKSKGFDYIDIDPFGSPNPFLDTAIKRLSRSAILGVTATDTAPLAGTYPKSCLRKYWALPLRNEEKHEIGLRILIRKVQLIGAQYSKALTPIFSYAKAHYMRIFFICKKGKKRVDKLLWLHGYYKNSGPLYLGKLWDIELVKKMYSNSKENRKFLSIIKAEASIPTIGFYDLHKLSKKYKLRLRKKQELIEEIKALGYRAAPTHFNRYAIKSTISLEDLLKLF